MYQQFVCIIPRNLIIYFICTESEYYTDKPNMQNSKIVMQNSKIENSRSMV